MGQLGKPTVSSHSAGNQVVQATAGAVSRPSGSPTSFRPATGAAVLGLPAS